MGYLVWLYSVPLYLRRYFNGTMAQHLPKSCQSETLCLLDGLSGKMHASHCQQLMSVRMFRVSCAVMSYAIFSQWLP
jgi:hypothetical protein